jgi:putative phage-type endonuclease
MEKNENITKNRHRYIGGSCIPKILSISPYSTKYELLQEKAGTITNEFIGNEYTEFGNIMEPKIRDYINKEFNYNFIEHTHINEELKTRSNVDGYDQEKQMLMEIKTSSRPNEKQNIKMYLSQLYFYMWSYGIEKALLVTYERPSDFSNI